MDRRRFFSWLCAAPVALPVIAAASTAPHQIQQRVQDSTLKLPVGKPGDVIQICNIEDGKLVISYNNINFLIDKADRSVEWSPRGVRI